MRTYTCIHYISQKKIIFYCVVLHSQSSEEWEGYLCWSTCISRIYFHCPYRQFWEKASNASERDSHVTWHVLRRVIAESLFKQPLAAEQKTEIGPSGKGCGDTPGEATSIPVVEVLSLILYSVDWQVEGSTYMVPFLFLRSPKVGAGRLDWSWVGETQVGGNFSASMLL